MAALDVIVREAGGRFSSLDGTDGPFGGNALASNGHLHEAALSFLGSLPDDDSDPDSRLTRARVGQRAATRGGRVSADEGEPPGSSEPVSVGVADLSKREGRG